MCQAKLTKEPVPAIQTVHGGYQVGWETAYRTDDGWDADFKPEFDGEVYPTREIAESHMDLLVSGCMA